MKKLILKTALLAILVSMGSILNAQSIIWLNYSHPQVRATYDAAFSSDGLKILSGSECHEAHIRIFDVVNGNILWDYQLDSSFFCVQGVKFSTNGNLFVAIEETGNLLVFDYTSGTPILVDTLVTGNSVSLCADIDPSNIQVAIGTDFEIKLYDLSTGNLSLSWPAHTGYIWSVDYSSDGQKIVSASTDNKAKIWSNTGTLLSTLNNGTADVLTAKFSPNDSLVVIGGRDDKIRIFDAFTGGLLSTLSGHTGDVNRIDISPDNRFVASASSDASIKIWDISSGALLNTIPDTSGSFIYSVQWSPDGTKLVSGNGDTHVILYDVSGITGISDPVESLKVRHYPNPAVSGKELNFEMVNDRIQSFQLMDIQGKEIGSETEFSDGVNSVMLPKVNSGVYVYKVITSAGRIYFSNIVIQ